MLALVILVAGCARKRPETKVKCLQPAKQLAGIVEGVRFAAEPWREDHLLAPGDELDREAMDRELNRLATICPDEGEVALVQALLASQRGENHKAIQMLDRVLADDKSHPEAAVLRAKLAFEQGGSRLGLALLERQILLRPDHPGLRESQAAGFFVVGRFDEARRELQVAEVLGAPSWRVAFNLGLIAEYTGDLKGAEVLYEEAVRLQPQWPAPLSRLRGLRVEAGGLTQ
ncbi:hypothetical protein ABI59_07195 [Acidobacteria bacterium Mor1]|nr:hypothetical protein ABI59_07195 [Acidobacteria bacterium Mor1]